MIQGHAEVRWDLRQWHFGDGEKPVIDKYDDEAAAREAFKDACEDRSVNRAKLLMVVTVEASTHFKTRRR